MRLNIEKSHYYAFSAVLLWSVTYVFTRICLQAFSYITLGFWRCLIASLVFVVVLKARGLALLPARKDYPIFILSGAVGFALYLIFFNIGLESLNSSTSCIIISTTPILSAILALFMFSEKLPPAAWLALGLAFIGIVALSLWDGPFNLNLGIFWTLGAALTLSLYNIVQRYCSRNYDPVQITAYSFFTGTLLLAFCLPSAITDMLNAPFKYQAIIAFMGIFPSAIAYLFWAKALAMASSTSSVVNHLFLSPFAASALGYLVMDERIQMGTVVGGIIVLLGLALFSLAMHRQAAKRPGA
ncbi:DMT family transporter [Desulfovibrio sp. OttesenSCG-928-C14]|nr:DMT family transporter [Desulfovibrio sp. OttesenSCG-928-C14]